MRRRLGWIGAVASLAAAALVGLYPLPAGAHGSGTTFQQVNLVSDQPGVAALTDPDLVNPWGMSHGPNTPIWVSNNGSDNTTLYRTDTPGSPVTKQGLVVSIPGGAPTGQVFNDTTAFTVPGTGAKALFIFAGEDGVLSAWNGAAGTTAVPVGPPSAGGIYKGLTLAHSPFGPLLLAANFHDNRVDVFDGGFNRLPVDRLFHDPFLPRGYAPFNVAEVGDQVFVTYALQGPTGDDVAGAGHGFVDVFTNYGAFVHRFASRGVLNSPWGLAIAPDSFGSFAGDVLIGNFGDGRIHAFDPDSGRLRGTLVDAKHKPIAIDGLWGLIVGDAVAGGADSVWFSAGPDGESHGLLGLLRAQ
ncbi:MAG TPA: TIGR03118 family protein [Jatrophihabitantaceae bacterium]|jgi:uncharacterized protein (TIGR03118 family)